MKTEFLHLKAFIVGSSFLVLITPFTYLGFFYHLNQPADFSIEYVPIFLPIVFGLINALYFRFHDTFNGIPINARYWLIGAIYGLGLSSYGTFVENLPLTLFKVPESLPYIMLPVAMCVYGCVWRYVMKNLNSLFGLE